MWKILLRPLPTSYFTNYPSKTFQKSIISFISKLTDIRLYSMESKLFTSESQRQYIYSKFSSNVEPLFGLWRAPPPALITDNWRIVRVHFKQNLEIGNIIMKFFILLVSVMYKNFQDREIFNISHGGGG